MAPYVAAVLSTINDASAKVKLYLPIDTLKYLDNTAHKWVWDTQCNEIVDTTSNHSQSMHDMLPMLPVARQCGLNAWDLRGT